MTDLLMDNLPAEERRAVAVPPARGETNQLRIWVVPHTHWDREWYLPFEQFRIHLARLIDDLLELLEQQPDFAFTFDGQAVVLEDYLEIRPEQEALLRRHIASGRIAFGPSYVLPDEFLAGQESLVRNLLMGRQLCARYGGPPMAVAYAPDTFGHIAQLPQILRGFGLDSFVFWRGLGDEAEELGAVFLWRGPDGSQLLAVRLLEGYANARDLGRWTRERGWVRDEPTAWRETAARRVAEFLERWREPLERASVRDVLLGNGVDHAPPQRDLPEMLSACAAQLPGTEYRIATLEEYVDALRWRLGKLQTHAGELVGGRECCVVRSVNSTRIYLKQANEATERALFVAEALAALASLRGTDPTPGPSPAGGGERGGVVSPRGRGEPSPPSLAGKGAGGLGRPYPLNELRLAWRELLRNHPHDSLPGCSIDEVHRDMEQRFRSAQQIARQIEREAAALLAGSALDLRPSAEQSESASLLNVLPWPRARAVELDLPPGLRRARSLMAETPEGELPAQILGRGPERRAVVVATVPGFGARQLHLRRGKADPPRPAPDRPGESQGLGPYVGQGLIPCRPTSPSNQAAESFSQCPPSGGAGPASEPAGACGPRGIQNGYYRVQAAPNGTIAVTDLRSGRVWSALHWFQDEADRGDEYSFCPLEGDPPWDSRHLEARSRVRSKGPLVAELEIGLLARLPRRLDPGRAARSRELVACPIRTLVRLVAGVDRIEFETTVSNRARDHRLRVFFPAPESEQFVRAEGHFAVLRRPAQPVWNGLWREPPAKTHHTLGMVASGTLALMARGLPEYEAIPNAEGGVDLALTLLRCVGWLSWSDLATRPGAEDPHIPTPDAQCLGSHTFHYALSLRGDGSDAELVRAAQDYRVEFVPGPAGADLEGTLRVEGDGFAMAALKGAEDGEGAILRLYNPGPEPAEAQVGGRGLTVRRCRLDETGTEPGPIESVPLRGHEVVTLRVTGENRD